MMELVPEMARVERTASTYTVRVGRRTLTRAAFRQLDLVRPTELEAWARVQPDGPNDRAVRVVGMDIEDGRLVRSQLVSDELVNITQREHGTIRLAQRLTVPYVHLAGDQELVLTYGQHLTVDAEELNHAGDELRAELARWRQLPLALLGD